MQKDKSFGGDSPKARFGHTITPIGKDKAILFGGAVGDTGSKYVITGDTYLCQFGLKKFKKLQCRGMFPTNRAAHSAIFIDHFVFVYGGALGGGQLADDSLYQLDVLSISDKAFWSVKACNGTTPSPRYGQVMGYLKPFLVIYGGNTGNEPVGDVWVNDIFGASEWKKVDTGNQNPPPRVYHSASICRTGTANGMMVIFGGRGADGHPLNDTWGLRKHRNNTLDWMKAPYRNSNSKPAQRYQHRTLFIGTLLLIIGGRSNNVGESMPLDIYDTDTSQWHRLMNIERFRHACFLCDHNIFIHGGFDQDLPNVPTDSILRLDLNKLLSGNPSLLKGLAFQVGKDILTHSPTNLQKRNSNQFSSNPLQQQQPQQRYSVTHGGRRSQKMDIQYNNHPIKRNIQTTDKPIRLCSEAIVANYNEQNEVKKIGIQELQSEHRKLNQNSMNSLSVSRKDMNYEHIARYFLSSLFCQQSPQIIFPIHADYLDKMLTRIQKIVEDESTLLKIRAPVKVFGDIHGQVQQLNRIFQEFGAPTDEGFRGDIESTNYLFLGDYVDRGTKSVQTILLLFALKMKYPENIFLLRGSHEDKTVNKSMGFGDQCQTKFKQNIEEPFSFFQRCNRVFQKLPLAALIDDSILCVHGGIGTTVSSLNQISFIERPIKVNHEPKNRMQKIVYELLWSDPCRSNEQSNSINTQHDYFKKKINQKFSDERAEIFCTQNQILTIVRSGQPISEGFEAKDSVITVFSASDYGGQGNKLSVIMIKKNEQIDPMVLNPNTSTRNRWIQDQQKKKGNSQQENLLRSISFTPPK